MQTVGLDKAALCGSKIKLYPWDDTKNTFGENGVFLAQFNLTCP